MNHNTGTPELLQAVERTAAELVMQGVTPEFQQVKSETLAESIIKKLTPVLAKAEDKEAINDLADSLQGKTAEEVRYLVALLKFKTAYFSEKATRSGEND